MILSIIITVWKNFKPKEYSPMSKNNSNKTQRPFLSLVIVHYGKASYSYLDKCIQTILQYDVPEGLTVETTAIINSADAAEVHKLQNNFPSIQFKSFSDNTGFSRAANTGIDIARGDYVLILNSDILFRKNTFEEIYRLITSDPSFAIAGLQLLYADGSLQYSKGSYPSIPKIFLGLFKPHQRRKWDTHGYDRKSETDWVSGAAMLVNKRAANGIHFDEHFFMYYEDVDLCYNIKHRGAKVIYAPSIQVFHVNPFHLQKNIPKELYYEIRKSQMYFFYKNYGFTSYMFLKFFTIFYISLIILTSFFARFFNKRFSTVYRVYIYVIRKIFSQNMLSIAQPECRTTI